MTATALYRYPNIYTSGGKSLCWYIFYKFFFELIVWLTALRGINNFPLFYIYCITETLLLTFLATRMYFMKRYLPFAYVGAALVLTGIFIEAALNWPISQLNTWSRFAQGAFLFCLYALAITRLPKTPHGPALFTVPEFWLCLSVTFFFSMHLTVALINNYSIKSWGIDFTAKLWILNSIANLVSNLFLLWSLTIGWKVLRRE